MPKQSDQLKEQTDIQHLKIREMRDILDLDFRTNATDGDTLVPVKSAPGFEKSSYRPSDLRREIEPWLTSLFQSEHLSLLAGAGLTTSVHYKATDTAPGGFSCRSYAEFDEQIQQESKRSALEMGRGEPNPEDQLRTAIKLRDALKILTVKHDDEPWKEWFSKSEALDADITNAIKELISGVLAAERSIQTDSEKGQDALLLLVSFLMSFASRTGTRDRLHVFTTNYDRLIEFGAELAGIRLIDRFIGTLSPLFRASRLDIDLHYNPPGIRGEPRYLEGVARFTKLHGSLDWIDDNRDVRRVALPFGASSHQPYIPNSENCVLIFPNEAKDRETADYPYVELHRDFAASICRPNSVLVTYGYSFGDDHINRVIRDMLTIPSTHLVIIGHGDTGGRLTRFYHDSKRLSQITLLIGSHLGNLEALVDYYLPKPAIDRASIRMAELLRARGVNDHTKGEPNGADSNGGKANLDEGAQ